MKAKKTVDVMTCEVCEKTGNASVYRTDDEDDGAGDIIQLPVGWWFLSGEAGDDEMCLVPLCGEACVERFMELNREDIAPFRMDN